MAMPVARRAIDRAAAFLRERQTADGELPVLASGRPDPSVFPTALAAWSLSFAPAAADVHRHALDFLAREMHPRGLWKHWPRAHPYSHQLPPDLDDTSCASLALERAGRSVPGNRELLLRNRNRAGLFYTWKLTGDQLRHPLVTLQFFRATSAKPFDVDAVVNANTLLYLGHSERTSAVKEHLLHVLRDGREAVCDKWYDNPFVVWYFLSRALRGASAEAGEILVRRASEARPSNALEHALVLCVMHDWRRTADPTPLLDLQLESGGWPAAGLYHGGRKRLGKNRFALPHPDTPTWGSEELTTVFCVEALARLEEA